jgi:hypothetical protein
MELGERAADCQRELRSRAEPGMRRERLFDDDVRTCVEMVILEEPPAEFEARVPRRRPRP